uniref:Uncharacterized protein n=1 Tax=Arundo donax TaxID=35708 RepID=A0A0A9E5Z1_ARUDO
MELMKQGPMRTVLSGLLAAFAWPATLLVATDFIDSKWSVAIDRCLQTQKGCSFFPIIGVFPANYLVTGH